MQYVRLFMKANHLQQHLALSVIDGIKAYAPLVSKSDVPIAFSWAKFKLFAPSTYHVPSVTRNTLIVVSPLFMQLRPTTS
jgi:hypothetical protein